MQYALRKSFAIALFAVVTLGASLILAGCENWSKPDESASTGSSATEVHDDHGHEHACEGPHGGLLIELGDEPYRAELVHDEEAHKMTVHLWDAETKKPVASDQTEVTLQVFEEGKFVNYTLNNIPDNADAPGTSRFVIVDEKLADRFGHADEIRGRLRVLIHGKMLTGVVQHEAHGTSSHDDDSSGHEPDGHGVDTHDHSHGDADHATNE